MSPQAKLFSAALALWAALAPATSVADEAALAALKAGGHVMLIRHALTTPGVGDPRRFKLEDCATQRNLVDQGREESRRLGALLRAQGIAVGRVLSSQWCRSLETARLMEVGEVAPLSALNDLFGHPQNREPQLRELRPLISSWQGPGTLVLVSHGSVIGALLGIQTGTAVGVVLKPAPGTADGFMIVGRIDPAG